MPKAFFYRKELKMKKTICIILIVAFAALLSTSAYFLIEHYRQETKQAELYDSLVDIVDSAAETEEEPAEPILFAEEKTVLPELAELYQQNSDLAGWIRIEDTDINYPVMHTPDNSDFYLKHRFEKEYSDYGCPYVQENCDVQKPSDNPLNVLAIDEPLEYARLALDGEMQAWVDVIDSLEVW